MGNCSSGCATGLGVLQIVIGVWFIGLMIPRICECEDLVRVVRVVLASISALFISSGSVAIATAWKTTTGLVTAAFVLSMLSSLVAFGLLILFAKNCYEVANPGWQWWNWLWQELWYICIMLVCLLMSLWPGCDEYKILICRKEYQILIMLGPNKHGDFAFLGVAMFGLFVGLPALIMFIVATISAAHSGKVLYIFHI